MTGDIKNIKILPTTFEKRDDSGFFKLTELPLHIFHLGLTP